MDNNTSTTPARSTSIKKMYLNKRAAVIRQTLAEKKGNISGFIEEVQTSTFNATKDELLFATALDWMQKHLHTEASVAELADETHVSVRKIQRLFTFFLDRTYTSVLWDMRLEAAKRYLAEFKNSIGEVAYLVGIKDHAYFTYLFRKAIGQTPSEYRQSLMLKNIDP